MVSVYRFEYDGRTFDLRVKLRSDMIEPAEGRRIILGVARALDEVLMLYPREEFGQLLAKLRGCCRQVHAEAQDRLEEEVRRHTSHRSAAEGGGLRGE